MAHDIIYQEYQPYKALMPFIDAFWTVTGANPAEQQAKLLPDGCVDIILNTGSAFTTDQGAVRMTTNTAYLVGTMTRYKEMTRPPGTGLVGIRFKPGGFSCFYPPSLLNDTADRTVEFDKALFPSIETSDLPRTLNHFFLEHLNTRPSQELLPILEDLSREKGNSTISDLAKKHYMTIRRLERLFQLHLGISPKEYLGFTRYQRAMEQIKRQRHNQTLLDIAFDCGYYDHAHMTREIKKHSGASPSQH